MLRSDYTTEMTGFNMTSKLLLPMFCHGTNKWKLYPAGCPGKIIPGGRPGLPLRLRDGKIILAGAAFSVLRLRRGLMTLPEATDPFGI